MRSEIERAHGAIPADAEMAVLGVGGEPLPLAEEREVGRLLQLGDEHACAESVRKAGGHVDGVADAHANPVQRAEQRIRVLVSDQPKIVLLRDRLAQADPDLRRLTPGPDDDPRLRLPERRSEHLLRERAIGMCVHRQPLRGVEELDQKPRRRAVARNVRAVAEHTSPDLPRRRHAGGGRPRASSTPRADRPDQGCAQGSPSRSSPPVFRHPPPALPAAGRSARHRGRSDRRERR